MRNPRDNPPQTLDHVHNIVYKEMVERKARGARPMPPVEVRIYRDEDGKVPLLEWIDSLDRKSGDRCVNALQLLAEMGHELRRPYCENLGEGIYELRVKSGRVNLRMLYAFDGRE